MEIIGIIAEYNPFHNGHIYHINQIKNKYPNSLIIAVISTTFTQRGHISILDPFIKTSTCLNNKIDLVVELPTFFSVNSADLFSYGAITILNHLKATKIIIGSESNDTSKLYNMAKVQLNNPTFDKLVQLNLEKKINYPTSLSNAIKELLGYTITTPNDLLGISYYKTIIENNYPISLETIQRTNSFHDNKSTNNIISASNIRNRFETNQDIKDHLPNEIIKHLNNDTNNNYFNLLKYKILENKSSLNEFLSVDEGIENRIIKYINNSNTLEELISYIKNKRYTYNKLTRMFTHILLGIKKCDKDNYINIDFIKILGFNNNGKKHLKSLKDCDIIITSNTNKINNKLCDLNNRSLCIYDLIYCYNNNLYLNHLKGKPVIYKGE